MKMNPNCRWKKIEEDSFYYFSNEHPLPFFHPRRFILEFDKLYSSVSDAVVDGMRSDEMRDCKDQILSYVLGYGASWEAFATQWSHNDNQGKPLYVSGKSSPLMFSDEHYHQLGEAIIHTQSKKGRASSASREECIRIGKEYSRTFMERMSSTSGRAFTIDQTMSRLHMEFVIDEIVRYTDYFRKSVAYRKRLLQFMKMVVGRIVPLEIVK